MTLGNINLFDEFGALEKYNFGVLDSALGPKLIVFESLAQSQN